MMVDRMMQLYLAVIMLTVPVTVADLLQKMTAVYVTVAMTAWQLLALLL
jgi:hypothetical protein